MLRLNMQWKESQQNKQVGDPLKRQLKQSGRMLIISFITKRGLPQTWKAVTGH